MKLSTWVVCLLMAGCAGAPPGQSRVRGGREGAGVQPRVSRSSGCELERPARSGRHDVELLLDGRPYAHREDVLVVEGEVLDLQLVPGLLDPRRPR